MYSNNIHHQLQSKKLLVFTSLPKSTNDNIRLPVVTLSPQQGGDSGIQTKAKWNVVTVWPLSRSTGDDLLS